jgi:hypothetical protein
MIGLRPIMTAYPEISTIQAVNDKTGNKLLLISATTIKRLSRIKYIDLFPVIVRLVASQK